MNYCLNGDVNIAKFLIKKGADVNIIHNDYTALKASCESKSFQCFKLLIEHGASPNEVIDRSGMTILHYACKLGNFKIVKYLVSNKANFNTQRDR